MSRMATLEVLGFLLKMSRVFLSTPPPPLLSQTNEAAKLLAARETQIKSNIFNFWPKINRFNQNIPFWRGVRGVAWENFHPYGVPCVFVHHFTHWFRGDHPS